MTGPVIVQTSTPTNYTSGLTATTTFASNPTPGNAIIVVSTHQDAGSANGSMSFADPVNGTYTDDFHSYHSSGFAEINWASYLNISASGSPLVVTGTYNAGTAGNMQGILVALEVSGLKGFGVGAAAVNASGNAPASGLTAALTNANSLALAILYGNASLAGATIPPTGGPGSYTDVYSHLASNAFGEIAKQVIAGSTAAVSAAWGTITTPTYWVAGVGVYYGAAAPITAVGASGSLGVAALSGAGTLAAKGVSGSLGVVSLGTGRQILGSGSGSIGVASLHDASAIAQFSAVGQSGSLGIAGVTATGNLTAVGLSGSAAAVSLIGIGPMQLVGLSGSSGIAALSTYLPSNVQAKGYSGSMGIVYILGFLPPPPPSVATLDFPLRDFLMANTIINPDAQTYIGPEPQPLAPPGFPRWMYNPVLPPVIVINTTQLNQLIALGTGWSTTYIGPYPVPNNPPASIAAMVPVGVTDNFNPIGNVPGLTSRMELTATDSTSALAGLVAAGDGWMVNLVVPNYTPLQLLDNASSVAGNSFILPGGSPYAINGPGGTWIQWIAAVNGWMVIN